ncbi:MAG TPA: hypothetical protein VL793_04990 [Patescibacteria group bacterium]|nr:hypothetical protein [Patescibacteria group bacterium]
MKAAFLLVTLLALAATQGEAQTLNLATNNLVSFTNAASGPENSRLSLNNSLSLRLQLTEPVDTNSVDYTISKTKVHLSGPAATTLKSRSAGDFSKRFLHLFNPFSSREQNLPTTVSTASGPVNTRAWSTMVGWSPGRSAFPDEHFHEPPQLRLISVSTEKQP